MRLFNDEQFPSRSPRYQTVQWGKDLQVWFLEGRDFRSPNTMVDGPEKTILGAQQKSWLFKTLDASTATFKLVFSPTPIVGPDRSGKKTITPMQFLPMRVSSCGESFQLLMASLFCVVTGTGNTRQKIQRQVFGSSGVGLAVKSISWVGRKVMSDPRIVSFESLVDFFLDTLNPRGTQVR